MTIGKNFQTGNSLPVIEHFTIREFLFIAYWLLSIDLNMLNLKYHLTEEEYFDYNYYTAWAAPDKKNYRLWYYLRVFILYGAVASLYIFSRRTEQIFIDLIIFGVIATVYFLMVPYLIKRSILRRVRNILSKP